MKPYFKVLPLYLIKLVLSMFLMPIFIVYKDKIFVIQLILLE